MRLTVNNKNNAPIVGGAEVLTPEGAVDAEISGFLHNALF